MATKTRGDIRRVAGRKTVAHAEKAAAPAAKVEPKEVVTPLEEAKTPGIILTKKSMIASVAGMTGLRKRDARVAVEATLELINRTLAASGEVSATPLGKLRVVRHKPRESGDIFICRAKLRDLSPVTPPLAEGDE